MAPPAYAADGGAQIGAPASGHAVTANDRPAPQAVRRLRRLGEACLWVLIIAAAAVAAFWTASKLRIVVLPVGLAIVLCTFLWPPRRRLREIGVPRGVAAALVLGIALAALATLIALLAPQAIDGFGELDVGISGGLDKIEEWLVDGSLGLSQQQREPPRRSSHSSSRSLPRRWSSSPRSRSCSRPRATSSSR